MSVPRPTGGGMLFLLAAAAALGTAFMNVGLITALVASAMAAWVVSGFLLAWFAAAGYEVRREPMQEGHCLGKTDLPLIIRNRTFLWRQPGVITESLDFAGGGRTDWELPALGPHETIRLKREITAVKRGHFHLEKIQLISGDPCGLFQVRKTFRLPGEIMIFPLIRPLESLPLGSSGTLSLTGDGRPLGHAGPGNDFFGVRPYRPGDEIRYIHWRMSASKQKLMVREFEASVMERVVLILDTDARLVGLDPVESNFEALVSLAASITEYFAAQYCGLTFFAYFNGNLMQINGDAAGIRFKVQELLTEIRPSENRVEQLLTEVQENLPRGTTLYLLSMSDPPELKKMLTFLEDQDIRLEWICAAKEYFPFVSEDEPMEMVLPAPDQCFPQVFGPRLLTFQTHWKELFRNEIADL